MTKPQYVTVSFSGGKDSTAMLLHMMELGEHIDEVINVDTGMEFPAMYDHIAKVREIVKAHGIKYTELRADPTFEYYLMEAPPTAERPKRGMGWPGVQIRWCTKWLKTQLIKDYLKGIEDTYNLVQCVGLAYDEQDRRSPSGCARRPRSQQSRSHCSRRGQIPSGIRNGSSPTHRRCGSSTGA